MSKKIESLNDRVKFDEIIPIEHWYEGTFSTTLVWDWLEKRGYNINEYLVAFKAENPEDTGKLDITIITLKGSKDLVIYPFEDDEHFIVEK